MFINGLIICDHCNETLVTIVGAVRFDVETIAQCHESYTRHLQTECKEYALKQEWLHEQALAFPNPFITFEQYKELKKECASEDNLKKS